MPAPAEVAWARCGRERQLPREILHEDGRWRCVEIPGFLVFSKLPDIQLGKFADEVRTHFSALGNWQPPSEYFRPGASQVPVILRQQQTPTMRPGDVRTSALQEFEDELTLIYVAHTPGVLQAERAISRPGEMTKMLPIPSVSAEMLVRSYIVGALRRSTPTPPDWLLVGLERLMREARFSGSAAFMPPAAVDPAQASHISIAKLFAPRYSSAPADLQHAWLFVRWALTGDEARRLALWRFAGAAARGPVHEGTFKECFGRSYGEVDVDLSNELLLNDGRLPSAPIASGRREAPLPPVEVRDADELEVASLIATIERINRTAMSHLAANR